ncbi:retropepsin-like aspartic protease family protein [Enhygromyxa salina]|uniref:retropepsin-like aspartic protease family protein n=1 Tax=Enhygromyxa salina TaxID=215803 RepID=UPI000D03CB9F|nr:retropepsin-like aspartic protease [Enhygromyxa salina]
MSEPYTPRIAADPRSRPPGKPTSLDSTLDAVVAGLGWVLLGLISLVVTVVTLLTVFSLARSANEDWHPTWGWLLALALTLGLPLALAAWKHHEQPKHIKLAMTWLPGAWNASALAIAVLLIPDLVGTALRSCEWIVQGHLGDAHSATRKLSAFGHEAADNIDPGGGEFPKPVLENTRVALDRDIIVPFTEQGAAIFLSLELEGPSGLTKQVDYLFDTGASYTTLTSATAHELGIEIPDDAPSLEFNTASGLRESRMVHLPALILGDVRIPGLLVSVCDSCATDRTGGLLGLNVMREFLVQMDYQGSRMRLLPRIHEGRPNRAYDIGPMLDLAVEGRPEIWLGRIRWVVTMTNTGSVPIEGAMPRVDFKNGPRLFGERVERIEPGEIGRSLLVGEVVEDGQDTGSLEFTLMLVEAYW